MKPLSLAAFAAVAVFVLSAESGVAQLSQLNGGANQAGGAGGGAAPGGAAAGAGGGAEAGGTTQAAGGLTTQGPGTSAAQDGGIAGGNRATEFVGAGAPGGFAGGSLETQINNNRIFRALTGLDVPTGGTRESSGSPRRVATTLRIAFAYPKPDASSILVGSARQSGMTRVAEVRPEFSGVTVAIDAAGVATLTGSVPDQSSSRLASNLVRLRPGVRRVQNQLAVAPVADPTLPIGPPPAPAITN